MRLCGKSRLRLNRSDSASGNERERAMHAIHQQFFLKCECGHAIPLPHPTLEEMPGDETQRDRAARTAVFACTDCGLVSAYTSLNVHETFLPTPDPHLAGRLTLGYIEPECEGKHCEAPRRIYMLGSGPETIGVLPMRKTLRGWRVSPSAKCEAGHTLALRSAMYRWFESDDFPL